MSFVDDVIAFAADVAGVLLGAFLGYLLGLRQQRKINSEQDDKRRAELRGALKAELQYLSAEVTRKSAFSSDYFLLPFDFIYLDLPTFTSIVNSGQLLLLDSKLVSALRELNTEIHEHNISQAIFTGFGGDSTNEEFKKILENPSEQTKSRLGGLLKVIMTKRKNIALKADLLIKDIA